MSIHFLQHPGFASVLDQRELTFAKDYLFTWSRIGLRCDLAADGYMLGFILSLEDMEHGGLVALIPYEGEAFGDEADRQHTREFVWGFGSHHSPSSDLATVVVPRARLHLLPLKCRLPTREQHDGPFQPTRNRRPKASTDVGNAPSPKCRYALTGPEGAPSAELLIGVVGGSMRILTSGSEAGNAAQICGVIERKSWGSSEAPL